MSRLTQQETRTSSQQFPEDYEDCVSRTPSIQRTGGTTTDVLVCSCVVVVGSHTNKGKSAESNSLTRTCHWQKRGAHLQQMSRHRRWQHLKSFLHGLLEPSTWRLDTATNRHRRIAHHRCSCKHATHHASFVKKSQINHG
ncbi:unnamed protein product [Ectocarpus sp. 12 AP-2014]